MIIRGGENIYPREIEEFLYKLDGVKDVQVAGIPSKKYGEAVGAFIILQEGVTIQAEDVRDFCRNKISRYKIPKYIFFVDEFPMTGSGKIQKFRLKDLGLKLCIEGIETEDELQKIKLLKPDYCQGFYWGRPCSYDEFRKYFVDVDR